MGGMNLNPMGGLGGGSNSLGIKAALGLKLPSIK
jgi:hypothetical protein